MPPLTTFSPTLMRQARIYSGLTQVRLGEILGCTHQVISHWETGFRAPTVTSQARIAKALGVTIRDLHTAHEDAFAS